ncbi:MAG: hypothetical protein ACOCZ8_01755 [Bacteroidota bacterium]
MPAELSDASVNQHSESIWLLNYLIDNERKLIDRGAIPYGSSLAIEAHIQTNYLPEDLSWLVRHGYIDTSVYVKPISKTAVQLFHLQPGMRYRTISARELPPKRQRANVRMPLNKGERTTLSPTALAGLHLRKAGRNGLIATGSAFFFIGALGTFFLIQYEESLAATSYALGSALTIGFGISVFVHLNRAGRELELSPLGMRATF